MRRWHEERQLMLRRWRLEIQAHEDTWKRAPLPPLPQDGGCSAPGVCHCYRGPGYFRKRHPFDCGNPRCGLCHFDKFYYPKARGDALRAAIAYELAAG